MPSLDAPGYYDRAKFILNEEHDSFLKLITPDDSVDDFGSVDFPLGHVMLVHLDRGAIGSIMGDQDHPEMHLVPEAGWYNVRTDSNSLIWGIGYGPDCTFNEEAARSDFNEGLRVWIEWSDENL